jgi:putative membrane protein
MISWFLVAHVFGFVLWVSGLLGAAGMLMLHTGESSVDARHALANLERRWLRTMADPGALLTILAGIALISTNPHYYLHAHWLALKMIFVLGLLGMHGMIGVRAKRFAEGRSALAMRDARLLFVLVMGIFLSILIATLPGAVYMR